MFYLPFSYDEPLFRPPSEAYSLIFQLTIGCSWNKCAFCEMYTSKSFKLRNEKEIFAEIEQTKGLADDTRKIFLADGNAFVLSFDKLIRILDKLNQSFPRLARISAYASSRDILSKTEEELMQLKNAGLKLLYIGIESGDDELLKMINKGETYNSTEEALLKARNAGIKLSVMILNGLGGKHFSNQHSINSAKLINSIQPEYLSTLVLSLPYGINHFKKRFNGEFVQLNPYELIKELGLFLQELNLVSTVFRSDHASNYLVLKGILDRDKEILVNRINDFLQNPEDGKLRPEWSRGL
ncbi:MAG: radical SAM protein [Bacteroidetes bacterium]|nr:radical SAM protein [Bacteroidota bacterium]